MNPFYWTATHFWTSCTDSASERSWFWDSTKTYLYPGYANWGRGQPDNAGNNENCMEIISGIWNDQACSFQMDAICEAHP